MYISLCISWFSKLQTSGDTGSNVQPHQAAANTELPEIATQKCGFSMNIGFGFTAFHDSSNYIKPETQSLTHEHIKHADAVIMGRLLQSRMSERASAERLCVYVFKD